MSKIGRTIAIRVCLFYFGALGVGCSDAHGSVKDAAIVHDAATLDASVDATLDAAVDASGTCTLGDGGVGTLCGSACVDTTSDPEHCGTCDQICRPGSVCEGHCTDIVGSLDGLRWELPCTSGISPDGFSCPSPARFSTTTTVVGTAGASYDVTLRFRGLVEQRTYAGGVSGGATGDVNPELFLEGGTWETSDPYNVYTLEIQPLDPGAGVRTFRLNGGTSNIHHCFPLDYRATVRVETGATLVLSADSIEGNIIANLGADAQPIVVADVPPAPDAFDGQFVQVDVVSVTVVP